MKYFTKEYVKKGSSAEEFFRTREHIYKAVPKYLADNFGFHDGSVLSFEQINGNIVMTVDRNCYVFEDQTRFVKVTFVNGAILECDDNLKFKSQVVCADGKMCYESICTWMYDELYKTDNGYEAHMLLLDQWEWGYLTIACSDIEITENITEQQIYCANLDTTLYDRINASCGLQQIISGNLHDAGVANIQVDGANLVLTLDINEGQTIDGIFYRRVAKITFENVSDCSVAGNEKTFIGFYVNRHREEIVDGKIRFAFELWNDNNNMLPLILHCDDVTVEYSLVDD